VLRAPAEPGLAIAEEFDLGPADDLMRQFGKFAPQEVPAGMPETHWWWFGGAVPLYLVG
jgi:hypothetical protein